MTNKNKINHETGKFTYETTTLVIAYIHDSSHLLQILSNIMQCLNDISIIKDTNTNNALELEQILVLILNHIWSTVD